MFSENIKYLRTANNISQDKLSTDLHISRTTVSAWEKGITEPDLKTLAKLRDYFKTTYEDLLD